MSMQELELADRAELSQLHRFVGAHILKGSSIVVPGLGLPLHVDTLVMLLHQSTSSRLMRFPVPRKFTAMALGP